MRFLSTNTKKYSIKKYKEILRYYDCKENCVELFYNTNNLVSDYEKIVHKDTMWGKKMLAIQRKSEQISNKCMSTLPRIVQYGKLVSGTTATIHIKLMNQCILEIYALGKAYGVKNLST